MYVTLTDGACTADLAVSAIALKKEEKAMTIHEWLSKHPDEHVRIICYTPAPDVMDENGNWVIGGEGISETVFDSTTGDGDLAPDLMLKEIINSPEEEMTDEDLTDPDHVWELEYIPDAYWTLY